MRQWRGRGAHSSLQQLCSRICADGEHEVGGQGGGAVEQQELGGLPQAVHLCQGLHLQGSELRSNGEAVRSSREQHWLVGKPRGVFPLELLRAAGDRCRVRGVRSLQVGEPPWGRITRSGFLSPESLKQLMLSSFGVHHLLINDS